MLHLFNPEIMTKGNLGEGFRLFTRNQEYSGTDNNDYTRNTTNNLLRVIVYTDESCQKNGSVEAVARAGAWFGPGDHRNLALRLPHTIEQSNNAGETYAVFAVKQNIPQDASLHIVSDLQLVIDSLTKNLKEREDNGWIGSANKELMKCLVANLRKRKGNVNLEKVKGYSDIEGNEGADALADEGVQEPTLDPSIDLETLAAFNIQGAKLAAVSQAMIYKGIIENLKTPHRRGTETHLDMTRWAVKALNDEAPTDNRIWLSLKDKAMRKETWAFLWKAMHNAHKIGR
ncbi:Ribonuclease H1 [Termitomyces sp. J132]|nr:Ribonuclease H1 [Termitomyces sp. J132]